MTIRWRIAHSMTSAVVLTALTWNATAAQRGNGADGDGGGGRGGWDVTQPRGKTRQVNFTISEGTRM